MAATAEPTPPETDFFSTLPDSGSTELSKSWRSETRLEMLAWEIVRYDPSLAAQLVTAGRRRLQGA